MYEAYFGLKERPFSIAPDPRYLYLSPRHREALAHLLYGITERGGFVQLTGEVGTGKTTITRALLEQMPEDVDLALILNPSVTVREFLAAICEELKIELPKRAHSPQALVEELTRHLLDAYARGRHTVVLVDEAQNLSTLVLEQVRLLTNLETTREKLMQIVLVGQPELRDMLNRPELRQVAQRITARYHLAPLSFAETRQYIQHRLAVAGTPRPLFTLPALFAVHRIAKGIPRLLNVICDRALLGAYADRRNQVNLRTALKAAREVEGREPRRWGRWFATATAAAAVIAGSLLLYSAQQLAPAAPEVAVPKEPTAERRLGLDERLQLNVGTTGADAAFGALFRLWHGDYRPYASTTACEQAQEQGLRCYYESGDWDALARRNLPAVIEMTDSRGQRHRVLLRGVRGELATLQLGAAAYEIPAADVRALWTGDSVALWRPPASFSRPLATGSDGEVIEWVVRRLDRLENRPTEATRFVFDAALASRVKRFQQAQGLTVDGVVGEMTLMRLYSAVPDPDAPMLSRY